MTMWPWGTCSSACVVTKESPMTPRHHETNAEDGVAKPVFFHVVSISKGPQGCKDNSYNMYQYVSICYLHVGKWSNSDHFRLRRIAEIFSRPKCLSRSFLTMISDWENPRCKLAEAVRSQTKTASSWKMLGCPQDNPEYLGWTFLSHPEKDDRMKMNERGIYICFPIWSHIII